MSNNAIVRGSFVSAGGSETIAIPCDVDYIMVYNETVGQANNPAVTELAVESKYVAGMDQDSAIVVAKLTGDNSLEMVPCAAGGFTIIDQAVPSIGAAKALGNPTFTQADPAVWDTTAAHGYIAGDIVRVYGVTAAQQYSSLDLTVTSVAAGTDKFQTLLDTAGITVGTAGYVRKLDLDVSLYYPRRRYIAKVTTGSTTVVRMTVSHGFKVDEYVRFIVPQVFGMTQLNGLRGKITAVDTTITTNTITVDIDSSAFDAFAFPDSADLPFSFAQVVPDSEYPGVITAAVRNVGIKGVKLGSVVAGNAGDTIRWIACQVDQASPFYVS
jgi:hypothetical protein